MKIGKKNTVSLNPLDYNIILLGESGIGKSSTMFNVCEQLVGDEGYIFLECGNEHGASAIDGINFVNVPDYNSEYDDVMNTVGLDTIVTDICKNKNEDWKELKVVVIDTIDQIFPILEEEVIRIDNKARKLENKPVIDSISKAMGGYMRGQDYAIKLFKDIESRLNAVGVKVIKIGHCKTKTLNDTFTEEQYLQLTAKLEQRYFSAIKDEADIMGLAYIDRELIREKRKENSKDMVNRISDETRKIKFRSSDYAVDNKCRFADIVEEIPLDADAFIKAITDAIKSEASKSGMSDKQLKVEQKRLDDAKAKKVAENIEAVANDEELEEIKAQIMDWISENRDNKDNLKPVLASLKEHGTKKPTEIEDIDTAKKIWELCK